MLKRIQEGSAKIATTLGGILLLLVLLVVFGAVRQVMSFTECSPGKPEMSLTAFIVAGFGGSLCVEPRPSPSAGANR